MIILYSYRWTGTQDENEGFLNRLREIFKAIEGVTFRGSYLPNTEFSAKLILETETFEKALQGYYEYQNKYGPHPRVSVQKYDILIGPPL
jgi:hypothetical protein